MKYRVVRKPGYKEWMIEIESVNWRGKIKRETKQFYDLYGHWDWRYDSQQEAEGAISDLLWRQKDKGAVGDWRENT